MYSAYKRVYACVCVYVWTCIKVDEHRVGHGPIQGHGRAAAQVNDRPHHVRVHVVCACPCVYRSFLMVNAVYIDTRVSSAYPWNRQRTSVYACTHVHIYKSLCDNPTVCQTGGGGLRVA